MAREVEEMAEKYQEPSDHQLSTIRKLTKAFELAKMAKMGPAPHQAEEVQPAAG
jgi:hypothetical protein